MRHIWTAGHGALHNKLSCCGLRKRNCRPGSLRMCPSSSSALCHMAYSKPCRSLVHYKKPHGLHMRMWQPSDGMMSWQALA